jgi:branched-chain amino acid transport system ATP-binding protein
VSTSDESPMTAAVASDESLAISDVAVRYGRQEALHGVHVTIPAGQVVGIIGSNGAGKSTLANAIVGQVKMTRGSVRLGASELAGRSSVDIVKRGISYVPEGRGLFIRMTVRENLILGGFLLARRNVDSEIERVLAYFPELTPKLQQRAGELSGGQQQMLAIARAVVARPRVLMLDEPTMGLAPVIVSRLAEIIRSLAESEQLTVVILDQRLTLIDMVAQGAHILRRGVVVDWVDGESLKSVSLEDLLMGGETAVDPPKQLF